MGYIADLHIHSRFSRACSPQLNIPSLALWSRLKGINLLGTGDFLHPLWLAELKHQLEEDGSGFLRQKGDWGNTGEKGELGVRFLLSVEVASIYSHKGKGRRIHNLIFMPDFASVDKFQQALLSKRATLGSDGRPIVGISSKDLLYMALQACDKAIFIPAHIWTPWFGILGSMSGYDSFQDCFEDLTDKVYGIETGLSSDPAMNWRVGGLDNKSILSFSDAHSLPNLGREAVVFNGSLEDGYDGLLNAISKQIATPSSTPRNDVIGTIEFYPEEGKYHYSGHRNCAVKYTPEDTRLKGKVCPVCGKTLTEGVMERVEALASRGLKEIGVVRDSLGMIKSEKLDRPGYKMLVPLNQVIAEAFETVKTSQKIEVEFRKLAVALGGEIKILTKVPIDEITKISGPKIAEGVDKDRKGDLVIDPGYDGVYGVVKIWKDVPEDRKEEIPPQISLFDI